MGRQPLERLIARLGIALPVVPKIEAEQVEPQLAEVARVGLRAPAIAEVFVAEDEDAQATGRPGLEVRTGQPERPSAVSNPDLLALGRRGATRSGKKSGFSSKIRPMIGEYRI